METKINLRELIRKVTVDTKFPPELLEKDFHLTRILHKIAEKKISSLVFKGGTCLNKCYFGFYRLSEDLDFVYNRDVSELSKTRVRKILSRLKTELFEVLASLGFEINKELGKGWKMLTSETQQGIAGLEIIARYRSAIRDTQETIKIEISFRKKLTNQTRKRAIQHKFYDALGEAILPEGVEIEVIDLEENFAENIRALLTRKEIAARDLYDIFFILKNKILDIDMKIINLALAKINETKHFTRKELSEFIEKIHTKTNELNTLEIESVIRTDEETDIRKMTALITNKFKKHLQ